MNLKIFTRLGNIQVYILILAVLLSPVVRAEEAAKDTANKQDGQAAPENKPAEGEKKMDTDDGKKDQSTEAEKVELDPELCNTELVRSYGFQGRVKPSLRPLEMCPTVRRNCCRSKDQLSMYASWIYGGQERLIKDRFNHLERIYMKFMNIANKVRIRAEEMMRKNELQEISNCNILAKRIVSFEVDELVKKVRSNLESMKNFFLTSFKGFYCAVCNFDNHKFFDLEEKILKVDDNFCYWTISHSLRVLQFFYNDVGPYSNIMSQFMMSCSNMGEYRFEITIPPVMLFTPNEEVRDNLIRCGDYIETNKWLPHCKFICDKFSVVGLSGFFEPNIKKMENYGKWLEAVYNEKVSEETQPYDIRSKHKKQKSLSDLMVEALGPVVDDVKKDTKQTVKDPAAGKEEAKKDDASKEKKKTDDGKTADAKGTKQTLRLLEEKKEASKEGEGAEKKEEKKEGEGGEKKEEKKEAAAAPKPKVVDFVGGKGPKENGVLRKELVVFRNDLEGKFPLEEFIYEYREHGIDFYIAGKNSIFEYEIYMQVKSLLHLGNLVKNKANMLSIFDKDFGRHFWCGSSRFSIFFLLVSILTLLLKF